ncbi:MAG: hypothetical protein AAF090_11435 [Bacteroidota bacterium]
MKWIVITLFAVGMVSCKQPQRTPAPTPERDKTNTEPKDTLVVANNANLFQENTFEAVVGQMTEISYDLNKFEKLTPEDNFLNKRIPVVNRYLKHRNEALEAPLDVSKIKKVERAKVKSTVSLQSNLYPRATLEYWKCHNEKDALDLLARIEVIKERGPWDVVSKSPITYFQKDDFLVFITPGGFYMLDLVPEIEIFLKERL